MSYKCRNEILWIVNVCSWATAQLKFAEGEWDRKNFIPWIFILGNLSLEGFVWFAWKFVETLMKRWNKCSSASYFLSCNGEQRRPGEDWGVFAWVLWALNPQHSCGTYTNNGEICEYCKLGVDQGVILSLDPELLEGVTVILLSSM